MMGEEQALDLAELRASQERDRGIAAAAAEVSGKGTDDCVACGDPIPIDRRVAAPFARRYIDCQSLVENEKRTR